MDIKLEVFVKRRKEKIMKVKDVIIALQQYNPDANISVIAHCRKYDFTLSFGGDEGGTKENCDSVSFYVDELCEDESEV